MVYGRDLAQAGAASVGEVRLAMAVPRNVSAAPGHWLDDLRPFLRVVVWNAVLDRALDGPGFAGAQAT